MTKTQARHEFRLYFSDLAADARKDGWKPCRLAEWEFFIGSCIENGMLPAEAADWTI